MTQILKKKMDPSMIVERKICATGPKTKYKVILEKGGSSLFLIRCVKICRGKSGCFCCTSSVQMA